MPLGDAVGDVATDVVAVDVVLEETVVRAAVRIVAAGAGQVLGLRSTAWRAPQNVTVHAVRGRDGREGGSALVFPVNDARGLAKPPPLSGARSGRRSGKACDAAVAPPMAVTVALEGPPSKTPLMTLVDAPGASSPWHALQNSVIVDAPADQQSELSLVLAGRTTSAERHVENEVWAR